MLERARCKFHWQGRAQRPRKFCGSAERTRKREENRKRRSKRSERNHSSLVFETSASQLCLLERDGHDKWRLGWGCPLLTLTCPGFDCGSNGQLAFASLFKATHRSPDFAKLPNGYHGLSPVSSRIGMVKEIFPEGLQDEVFEL